jgi:hypothetical protein
MCLDREWIERFPEIIVELLHLRHSRFLRRHQEAHFLDLGRSRNRAVRLREIGLE